jgi:hypothetical protein
MTLGLTLLLTGSRYRAIGCLEAVSIMLSVTDSDSVTEAYMSHICGAPK